MVAISAPDSIWAAIPTPTSGMLRRRIDLLVPCPEGDAPIMTAFLSAVDPRRMARWPIDFDEAYEYFPQALNDSMELGSPAELRRVGTVSSPRNTPAWRWVNSVNAVGLTSNF